MSKDNQNKAYRVTEFLQVSPTLKQFKLLGPYDGVPELEYLVHVRSDLKTVCVYAPLPNGLPAGSGARRGVMDAVVAFMDAEATAKKRDET